MKSYHESFDWCISIEIVMNVCNEMFGLFFACLILIAFNGDSFNFTIFMTGLGYFLVGVISIIRFCPLVLAGNRLTDAMHTVREKLASANTNAEYLDDGLRYQMEVLLERLDKSAAIQPYNVFDLSKSSALSLQGIIFTYIIVLIQFKLT